KECYSVRQRFHTSAPGRRRAKQQLAHNPTCAWCEAEGRIVEACVAHHVRPFGDSWEVFMSIPLVSLCAHHHNMTAQQHERGRAPQTLDAAGYPVRGDAEKV